MDVLTRERLVERNKIHWKWLKCRGNTEYTRECRVALAGAQPLESWQQLAWLRSAFVSPASARCGSALLLLSQQPRSAVFNTRDPRCLLQKAILSLYSLPAHFTDPVFPLLNSEFSGDSQVGSA